MTPWEVGGQPLIDRLKELHTAGGSFAQIAAQLSAEFKIHITRNSALGKADRLGFPKRAITHSERSRLGHRQRRVRMVERVRPCGVGVIRRVKVREIVERFQGKLADVVPQHVDLLSLGNNQCHYPYGDGPFTFCGCPVAEGFYCGPHYALTREKDPTRPQMAEAA